MTSTTIIADYASIHAPNIPFYADALGLYGVVVTTDLTEAQAMATTPMSRLIGRAVELFILHYLPEYADYILQGGAYIFPADSPYIQLKDLLLENIRFFQFQENPDPGLNKLTIATKEVLEDPGGSALAQDLTDLGMTTLDFALLREYLASQGWPDLPTPGPGYGPGGDPELNFQNAMGTYDQERNVTSSTSGTSVIYLTSLVDDVAFFARLMWNFHFQREAFTGTLKHPIDFRLLARKIPYLLKNVLLLNLFENINAKGTPTSFLQGDYLQLGFGHYTADVDRPSINSIEYHTPSNLGGSLNLEFAKVGYFTLNQYISYFQDDTFVKILLYYNNIIDWARQYERDNIQVSFLDFMVKWLPPPAGSAPEDVIAFGKPSLEDYVALQNKSLSFKNLEANVNTLNVQNIYQSLNNILCMDEEEVAAVREATNDKKTQSQIFRQEKNKVIDTGIAITSTAETVLTNRPITGLTSITGPDGKQTKGQKVLNLILSQIGIDELAKEVLTCYTYGMNFEAGRFAAAIRASLSANRNNVFSTPPPATEVSRKSLWEDLDYYSVTGDPALWKDMLNLLLSAIAQGAYSIITGLASLIRARCQELLGMEPEPGVIDISILVRDPNNAVAQNTDIPDFDDAVDAAMENLGLTPEEGDEYLSDVSSILTVPELCRLFYSQEDVSDDLIDKILEFTNSNYPNSPLNSPSAILSFFAALALCVDFRQYCDDWINNELVTAMQNCCLTEGDLLDALGEENLENILDIINGDGVVEPPPVNMECPESENYVDNSIMSNTIPSLFDTFMTPLQLEFAYAADSVKSHLLDTTIENNGPAAQVIAEMINSLGLSTDGLSTTDGSTTPSADTFGDVASAFQEMSDLTAFDTALLQSCPVDWSKFGTVSDIASIITTAFGVFSDSSAAAAEMFTAIEEKINSLGDDAANPDIIGGALANVPYSVYTFPQRFRDNFENYFPVGISEVAGSTTTGPAGNTLSYDSWFERDYVNYGIDTISGNPAYFVTDNLGHLHHRGIWNAGSGGSFNSFRMRFQLLGGTKAITLQYPNRTVVFNNDIAYRVNLPPEILKSMAYPRVPLPSSCPPISSNINPAIWAFVGPAMESLDRANSYGVMPNLVLMQGPTGGIQKYESRLLKKKLSTQYFAAAFTGLVSRLIPPIVEKGIFTVEGVNNLNFFKDNTLCDPENVGDLLDVDGIMDQINNEFIAAACYDSGPFVDRIKDTLRYGLFNLLVQIIFVEFLIKNIFVIAAFDLKALIEGTGATGPGPIFRQIMVGLILTTMQDLIDPDPLSSTKALALQSLFRIYNNKLQRHGGAIPYTSSGDLLTPRPGTSKFQLGNADDLVSILSHLVKERITYTWQDDSVDPPASRSTVASVLNILDFNNPSGTASLVNIFQKDSILWTEPYLGQLQTIWPTATSGTPAGTSCQPHFSSRLDRSTLADPQVIPRGSEYGFLAIEKYVAWNRDTVYDRGEETQAYNGLEYNTQQGPNGSWNPGWAPEGGILNNAPILEAPGQPGNGWQHLPALMFFHLTEWCPELEFPDLSLIYKLVYYFPIAPQRSGEANDVNLDDFYEVDYNTAANADPAGTAFAGALQKEHIWGAGFQGVPIGQTLYGGWGAEDIYYKYAEFPETRGQIGAGGGSVSLLDSEVPPDGAYLCPVQIAVTGVADLGGAAYWGMGGGYSGPDGNLYSEQKYKNFSGFDPNTGAIAFPATISATTGEYIPNSQEGGFCNPRGNSYDRNIVFATTPWGGILKFFGSYNTPASSGFDAEMIQLLPLLINVSYTNEAFRGINKSFKGPKDTVLSLLGIIDKNQTQASRDSTLGRGAVDATVTAMANPLANQDDFGSAAQAFILKAIKEWALSVLKALMELLDPHVHVSKIIRDLTSEAFIELSKLIQVSIEESRDPNNPNDIIDNLTGSDVVTMLLCIIDLALAGQTFVDTPAGLDQNARFFPKISMKGVDFTATGLGMLMIPPSPIGLLYCLLYALSIEPGSTNDQLGADATAVGNLAPDPSNEC